MGLCWPRGSSARFAVEGDGRHSACAASPSICPMQRCGYPKEQRGREPDEPNGQHNPCVSERRT